jgi:hypothetical protein
MLFITEESSNARTKKLNAVVNHPLLGGAKSMTLTLKRPGVGLFEKKKS